MKAAIDQGLVDKVIWGSSTPIANTFMAKQFPQFDGKMFINQEFRTSTRRVAAGHPADARDPQEVHAKIAPQAFAQMGFMVGKFATQALLNVKGAVTAKSYNAAVRGAEERQDGHALQAVVRRRQARRTTSRTTSTSPSPTRTARSSRRTSASTIAPVDKELAQTRVWEKKFKLNTGEVAHDRTQWMIRVSGGTMHSFVAFTVFGVDWEFLKPYIVLGLALGGVYALSGVGIVVLYQATGVLNLAFGAIGAAGALIAYWIVNHTSWPHWLAYLACVAFGGVVNLVYGVLLGPAFAARDPLVKMMGTLGLALILLGVMAWRAPAGGAFVRVLQLPTLEPPLRRLRRGRQLDAGPRARVRRRRSRSGRPLFLRVHEARHRHAGDRERPRDHRHARRARAQGRGGGLARLGPRLRRAPACCSPTCSRRSTTPRSRSSSSRRSPRR